MNLEIFGSAAELAKYVTDNTLSAANCKILEVDGQWYLFWWS